MKLDEMMMPFDIGLGSVTADRSILDDGRLSAAPYTSREWFEREAQMFGHIWLNIAEAAELSTASDWIVREVVCRAASVLLVRGKDLKIRAFHNICKHRGMKLVWKQAGHGSKFSCPYHAWTYDTEGVVTHIPDAECFPHAKQGESRLTSIACDVWEGFVFINLDPNPPQSLLEYLGPVAKAFDHPPFAQYPTRVRSVSRIGANWKLGVEAQSESYHAATLHARTVAKMLASKDNPLVRNLSSQALGPHRSQSIPFNPEFRPPSNRLIQCFAFANAAPMVFGNEATGKKSVNFADQPGVNTTGSQVWSNEQFAVYPNFVLHVSMGGWFYHRFWPIDERTTNWEVVYHFRPTASLRESFANQYFYSFNRDTLLEDNAAIEQQQEQLHSGFADIQFGTQEMTCRHFAAVNSAVVRAISQLAPTGRSEGDGYIWPRSGTCSGLPAS
jgi:phenylpropionate dioxygenase-like ring-hydroxylating dioxygenase large terminal subunit